MTANAWTPCCALAGALPANQRWFGTVIVRPPAMLLDGYNGLTQIQSAHLVANMDRPVRYAPANARGDNVVMGIVWVTVAMAIFAGLAAFARASMNAGVPPFQVVFLRNLFALLALSPLLFTRGFELFQTPHLKLYGLRSGLSAITMLFWFYALSLIPIGELTAISFLAPLFGTLAAVFLLGEVVRARRWTALLVGFVGAMIILRPGGTDFGLGQACAVLSAMIGGFLAILVKQLTSRDDTNRIVFLTTVIVTPLSLLPALAVWTWPAWSTLPLLLGMGLCAVLGHLTLTRAFASMDASLVLTFEFSKLPFAVAVAYFAFGEVIDIWTWVGALIIFGSAVYISRREAMLRRQKAAMALPLGAQPRTA
jgi:drug/metabolite transporter (DMT)-like permease